MTETPFSKFLKSTQPGPQRRCTGCNTFSLRTHTEPASQEEKVICTNPSCRRATPTGAHNPPTLSPLWVTVVPTQLHAPPGAQAGDTSPAKRETRVQIPSGV